MSNYRGRKGASRLKVKSGRGSNTPRREEGSAAAAAEAGQIDAASEPPDIPEEKFNSEVACEFGEHSCEKSIKGDIRRQSRVRMVLLL